jgi:predicted GNAT family acetyltransferase
MHFIRYNSVADFIEMVQPKLLLHEAENCLMMGLCTGLNNGMSYSKTPPYFAVVMDENSIALAALSTPPFGIVIAHESKIEAIDLLVKDLIISYPELPTAQGAPSVALAFATQWQQASGKTYYQRMAECTYRLEQVHPIENVPGYFRPITEEDRPIVTVWWRDFEVEAKLNPPPTNYDAVFDRLMRFDPFLGRAYLWEDEGRPVSLAATSGPTPNGIRIGPVYTPPEYRGRGYASTCVASLSQMLRDEGRRYCFLFTDLANPTSNHIYQKIGYQPICDISLYAFNQG